MTFQTVFLSAWISVNVSHNAAYICTWFLYEVINNIWNIMLLKGSLMK